MNSTTESDNGASLAKNCGVCKTGKPGQELFSCSRCFGISYCSKECQKADWAVHKILCKEFAETPCPDPSDKSLRRIFIYAPYKPKPEIAWVSADANHTWALKLNRKVLGMSTTTPMTEKDCLNPHYVLHPPQQPAVNYHTFIMLDGLHLENNVYTCNQAMSTTMEKAGHKIHHMMGSWGFKGPLFVTRQEGSDIWSEYQYIQGPKLLNANMEDFTDSVKYCIGYQGVNYTPPPEEVLLRILAWIRFCPEWRKASVNARRYNLTPAGERDMSRAILRPMWEEKLEKERQALADDAGSEPPQLAKFTGK